MLVSGSVTVVSTQGGKWRLTWDFLLSLWFVGFIGMYSIV